jgi:hypothetical protein
MTFPTLNTVVDTVPLNGMAGFSVLRQPALQLASVGYERAA